MHLKGPNYKQGIKLVFPSKRYNDQRQSSEKVDARREKKNEIL